MIQKIHWIVIKWKQLWRTIWFPTANIKCLDNTIKDWVYKINIVINNKIYHWAWVYRKNLKIFESFIFDFDKNIYWEQIEVILLEKIRENIKVKSFQEVKELIKNDVKQIKSIKSNILTFWTFDCVHKWHEYFLNQAKKYWDNLITIIATDINIKKFKWKSPLNDISNRIIDIKKLNISNEIIWWSNDNPLKWLKLYYPCVICLWYDQEWYSNELIEYIKNNKLNINIIRINSFIPEKYKSSIIKNKKIL